MAITDIRHPDCDENNWIKWRLTYKANQEFLNTYLYRFSKREDDYIFRARQKVTYVPAFAKAAVTDIRNAIFQRASDIIRDSGSDLYQQAISGALGGVDLFNSTMSFFIAQKILPELLPMSKVGVFIDMPKINGPSKLDKGNNHPYLYIYPIEDIINWIPGNPGEFKAVLLRDHGFDVDTTTGFPTTKIETYRYLYLNDQGTVTIEILSCEGEFLTREELAIPKIPFVVADIGESIIAEAADYQIALMNIESSDLIYILLANFPFYVEEYNPRQEALYNKNNEEEEEIETGLAQGRRYPSGTNQPAFIFPSPEPLRASMEKGAQLKSDIKALVNIAVSNLGAKMASAESKAMDMVGLEAGLSYIGLVLQNLEQRIGEIWSLYESAPTPIILYPTEYSLPDQSTINSKIDQCINIIEKINAPTLRKSLACRVAHLMVGNRLSADKLAQIDLEIENAQVIYSDPKTTINDVINGVLDPETAASLRGYPSDTVQKAQDYQAKRVALIQAAQSPTPIADAARGAKDIAITNSVQTERTNVDGTPKPVRGDGKLS